jgi:5,5'-dehydrodivanillate O-demethylase
LDQVDIVHCGPDTLSGRYIRTFWQPVFRSCDLVAGRPRPLKILGGQFTIYRGESGKPHVVGFRCAHRATQLHTGWIEGETLRCFYHGWRFDGAGKCVERPGEKVLPGNIGIPGYPTREYLGLIFAYFGQGEPPPFPRFKAMEQEGVLDVTVDTMPVNFFYSLENDAFHFAFTHRDLLPARNLSGVPEVWAEESEWGITTFAKWPNSNSVGKSHKGMPNVGYIVPSAIVLAKNVKHALHVSWRVPRDDESHTTFRVNLMPMSAAEADGLVKSRPANYDDRSLIAKYGDAVLAGDIRIEDIEDRTHIEFIQDYVVQVGQGSMENRRLELLGRTDASVVLLRKIWRRELTAFAAGAPLKQWRLPPDLEPIASL